MKINGLDLPTELVADLQAGGPGLSEAEVARFKSLLNRVESPLPEIFDLESINRENQLWTSDSAQHYIGTQSQSVVPGDVDPNRTLIIGQAEPDSPIALDYRTVPPRVVYLGDIDYESYWIQLSPDYRSLLEMIRR